MEWYSYATILKNQSYKSIFFILNLILLLIFMLQKFKIILTIFTEQYPNLNAALYTCKSLLALITFIY